MINPLFISLAILACYRIAILISEDAGPFYIFEKIRVWAETRATDKGQFFGFNDAIHCSFCVGLWVAIFLALMIIFRSYVGDFIILAFGIAGAQTLLQKWIK